MPVLEQLPTCVESLPKRALSYTVADAAALAGYSYFQFLRMTAKVNRPGDPLPKGKYVRAVRCRNGSYRVQDDELRDFLNLPTEGQPQP